MKIIQKKLLVKKTTIASLDERELERIRGGETCHGECTEPTFTLFHCNTDIASCSWVTDGRHACI